MQKEKRLIDEDAVIDNFKKTKIIEVFPNWKEMNPITWIEIIRLTKKYREIILNAKTVDAVMISDLKAWLYEIAMNNVGVKFDGDFSDAVYEIIKRLDGLREFSEERRTDGRNAAD